MHGFHCIMCPTYNTRYGNLCIVGQVLLEPSTLFTPVCYKHTHYYSSFSLATAILQVQEYAVSAYFPSFRYTLQDGGIKSDITMHAAGHEWHWLLL